MRKLTLKGFVNKALARHGGRYTYANGVYADSKTKLLITCPVHGDFEQTPNNHLNGQGCDRCGGTATLTTEEFIVRAVQIHGGKYTYQRVEYAGLHANVTITCPEHGNFQQTPSNHLCGKKCQRCAGNHSPTTEEFIQQANEKHDGRYAYSKSVYAGASTKLIITCPLHGDFKQTPDKHLNAGQQCPKCKESKGEASIRKTLEKCGIEFNPQHKFPDCKDRAELPFDFAIMQSGTVVGLIEYHGEQHYAPVRFRGMIKERADEAFVSLQRRDVIKEGFARAKNLPLLVIPHSGFDDIEPKIVEFVYNVLKINK